MSRAEAKEWASSHNLGRESARGPCVDVLRGQIEVGAVCDPFDGGREGRAVC